MLSIDCYPQRIGVDNGSMVNAGDVGVYNLRNEDGSITFSFETGGYALEDGTTYQLELSIDVDEWTESGRAEKDPAESQSWTVSFQPIVMMETAEPEKPTKIPSEAVQQTGYKILVPMSYQETGTMPVYQAAENDFMTIVQPEWFNQSGIAKEEKAKKVPAGHSMIMQNCRSVPKQSGMRNTPTRCSITTGKNGKHIRRILNR